MALSSTPPRILTTTQVASAPAGAARENMRRCIRAARFERPDLRRTEERANEAGALWRRIARKIMKLRERLEEVLLAPRAMPSAREWITKPRVVEKEELLGEELVYGWSG